MAVLRRAVHRRALRRGRLGVTAGVDAAGTAVRHAPFLGPGYGLFCRLAALRRGAQPARRHQLRPATRRARCRGPRRAREYTHRGSLWPPVRLARDRLHRGAGTSTRPMPLPMSSPALPLHAAPRVAPRGVWHTAAGQRAGRVLGAGRAWVEFFCVYVLANCNSFTLVMLLRSAAIEAPLAVVFLDDARERRLALGGCTLPFGGRRLALLHSHAAPPASEPRLGVGARAVDRARLVHQVRRDRRRAMVLCAFTSHAR